MKGNPSTPSAKCQGADLTLKLEICDAADLPQSLDPGLIDTVSITPAPVGVVPRDALVYSVARGHQYHIAIKAKRGLYVGGAVDVVVRAGDCEETVVVPLRQRRRVLYVTIDRPASAGDQAPNVAGLEAVARSFSPPLEVEVVDASALLEMTLEDIENQYEPLMIFGAGSYTPFFWYGHDNAWKRVLDHYAELIRTMDIPMLAVCGSHQWLAIAYKGTGAVAHMEGDRNASPVTIADEIAEGRPKPPRQKIAEIGTYPVRVCAGAAADPILSPLPRSLTFSEFHYDMVLESAVTDPLELILEPGFEREKATEPALSPENCRVQGFRLVGSDRLLYGVQFHPEIAKFSEAMVDDAGDGAQFLRAFVVNARAFWASLGHRAAARTCV